MKPMGAEDQCAIAPLSEKTMLSRLPAPIGFVAALLVASICGCGLVPSVSHKPSIHNPFPQLKRVAVLPFFNQSSEPTVDGEAVAEAYYTELQAIPGFEVLPVGVTRNIYVQYSQAFGEPTTGPEFQRLAQTIGVDAIVVGSVTDFSAYYPPRMAMTTNWYAANPGFHPIPPGYGLPWGTKAEKHIPRRIKQEAEFELARQQLATQTPRPQTELTTQNAVQQTAYADDVLPVDALPPELMNPDSVPIDAPVAVETLPLPDATLIPDSTQFATDAMMQASPLPPDWPSPLGLIPDGPQPTPPPLNPQTEPIITHTRLYQGNDSYFTERLTNYVEKSDDARNGGWQNYLKRSNDFIRFCCHLHIAEMLESRGGRDQSDLILRWPISRY